MNSKVVKRKGFSSLYDTWTEAHPKVFGAANSGSVQQGRRAG